MKLDSTSASHLPAPLPSPGALLQRTHATLGVLREVVQESSAEYWYEQGKKANKANEWENATHAFNRCLQNDNQHWRSALQLAVSLSHQNRVAETAAALVRAYQLPYKIWWKFLHEIHAPDKIDSKSNWYLMRRVLSFGQVDKVGFSPWRLFSKLVDENYHKNDIFNILFGLTIIFRNIDSLFAERTTLLIQSRLLDSTDRVLIWQRLSRSLPIDKLIYYTYKEYDNISYNPMDAEAICKFANMRLKMINLINEFNDYDFSHEINPDEFDFYPKFSISKELLSYESILSTFNEAISIKPNDPHFYKSRSNVKEKLGNTVGAENDRQIAQVLHDQ